MIIRDILAIQDQECFEKALLELDASNVDDMLKSLVQNPYLDEGLIVRLERVYSKYWNILNSDIEGALGFFLFTILAEKYRAYELIENDSSSAAIKALGEVREKANLYLQNKNVRAFCFQIYGIDMVDPHESMQLHKVGTTSIILRSNGDALKLIKPRYFEHPSIIQNTSSYQVRHLALRQHTQYTPEIKKAGDRYILMQFIEGSTLREYFELYFRTISSERRFATISSIFSHLCQALTAFAEEHLHHFDLSPDNIIIEDAAGEFVGLKVIDFGYNYLVKDRGVPSSLSMSARMLRYVAPEILSNDSESGNVKSDLYSLGIIFLELLAESKFGTIDIPILLDTLWRKHPDFAPIIERMIDSNPANRYYPKDVSPLLFQLVHVDFEKTMEIYKRVGYIADQSIFETHFWHPLEWLKVMREMSRRVKGYVEQNMDDDEIRDMFKWLKVATFLRGILWVLAIVFAGFDIGLWKNSIAQALDAVNWPGFLRESFTPGLPSVNLAGRLIGASFALIATETYLVIYGQIATNALSRSVRVLIRLNAWFYAVPIFCSIVIKPSWWPLWSAIGVLAVTASEYVTYEYARKGYRISLEKIGIKYSGRQQEFLDLYSGWYRVLLIYFVAFADSEARRPLIPTERDHLFRRKAATDSERTRPPIPTERDHPR